jgi:hypothetical protein
MFIEQLPKEDGLTKVVIDTKETVSQRFKNIEVFATPALLKVSNCSDFWARAFDEHCETFGRIFKTDFLDKYKGKSSYSVNGDGFDIMLSVDTNSFLRFTFEPSSVKSNYIVYDFIDKLKK